MSIDTTEPKFGSKKQGSCRYGISVRTIERLISAGKLTKYRAGNVTRIDLNELDALFRQGGAA